MSIKFSILNMNYQTINQDKQKPCLKSRKKPNHIKPDTFPIKNPQIQLPASFSIQKESHNLNKNKFSIYQQYKLKQYDKKQKHLERNKNRRQECFFIQGFVKKSIQKDYNQSDQFADYIEGNFNKSQILHARNKYQSNSPRRGLSVLSQAPCLKVQNVPKYPTPRYSSTHVNNPIGILGTKTLFMQKYRLKYISNDFHRSLTPLQTSNPRINRRQLLCSRKNNRVQSRNTRDIKTTQTLQPRRKLLEVKELGECRPWSPNEDRD